MHSAYRLWLQNSRQPLNVMNYSTSSPRLSTVMEPAHYHVISHGSRKAGHPYDRPNFMIFFASVVKQMLQS